MKTSKRITGWVPGDLYLEVVRLVVNGEYVTISEAVETALSELVSKHKDRKRAAKADRKKVSSRR